MHIISENLITLSHNRVEDLEQTLVSVISTPFPWSPLKLHSMEWEWSSNLKDQWSWSGIGVEVREVGVGMELQILNFSETNRLY